MPKEIKKEVISRIISIVTTLSFLGLATWFWFGPRMELSEARKDVASAFLSGSVLFTDLSEGINLDNAFPVDDAIGLTNTPYSFAIENTSDKQIKYAIQFSTDYQSVLTDNCKVLANNYLRYIIQKDNGEYSSPRNMSLDGTLYVDNLEPHTSAVYNIKLWIDYNAGNEIMDTHFHGIVGIREIYNNLTLVDE